MWVFAYDPADDKYVQRRDLSYWPLRHGSPLKDKKGVWVPTTFIPILREFSEIGDLYIAYLPNTPDPSRQKFYTTEDRPSRGLYEKLDSLEASDFALAIEFTYHSNWGSNGIQRIPILYESASRGIPTTYALPESAEALRGTERRGDQNIHHKTLSSELEPICKRLVENNEPITFSKIKNHVEDEKNGIDVEIGETATNNPDPKVPLFCKTAQDTFRTPVATIQFDEVVTAVPRDWKMSGVQLEPVFKTIKDSMDYMVDHGESPTIESGIFDEHNEKDQEVMNEYPPNRPHVRRNETWDNYHINGEGFPHGSLGLITDTPRRYTKKHNYSIFSNKLVDIFAHPNDSGNKKSFEAWMDQTGQNRNQTRLYSGLDYKKIPHRLRERPMVLTFTVTPYGGSQAGTPRWQNVDERTYAGKFMLYDLCFTRTSEGSINYPRKMATNRLERECVFAASLPMASEEFFNQAKENARFKTYLEYADIIVFDDGGFLGQMWWEDDKNPVKIF